jgi:hypothetical protein
MRGLKKGAAEAVGEYSPWELSLREKRRGQSQMSQAELSERKWQYTCRLLRKEQCSM